MVSQVASRFCLYNVCRFEIPPGFVALKRVRLRWAHRKSLAGSDEENHQVTLTHEFYMSDHEVTAEKTLTAIIRRG